MLNRKTKVMSNCQVQITSLFSIMHYLKAFTQFFSVSELNTIVHSVYLHWWCRFIAFISITCLFVFICRNKPLGMDQRFFSSNQTSKSVIVNIFHLMIFIYTVQMDGVFFRLLYSTFAWGLMLMKATDIWYCYINRPIGYYDVWYRFI